jgi:heterotetrameric sarcosine oxidase gamma subunit
MSEHPIRRSALEAVHTTLGARWTSDVERWPLDYGSADAERARTLSHGGLAELGPIDKLLVASPAAGASLAAAGLPFEAGRLTESGDVQVWGLALDEAIVLAPRAEDLSSRIGAGAHTTDVSSGWSCLRLAGPAVPRVLEAACAVDLGSGAVGEGELVQAAMANVRVILARRDLHVSVEGDTRSHPGVTLLVARDMAEYLWGALLQLGREEGLTAVGGRAVGDANDDLSPPATVGSGRFARSRRRSRPGEGNGPP